MFLFGGERVYRHFFSQNKSVESYRSKDIEIRLGEEGGEGEREGGEGGREGEREEREERKERKEGGSKGRRGKEERKDGGRNTHTLTPSQA